MIHVHVHIRVKPESLEAFVGATAENARHSVEEPGVARFELIQSEANPTEFVLMEAYRSQEAQTAHKETAHFHAWMKAVGPMMAGPRRAHRFTSRVPDAHGP